MIRKWLKERYLSMPELFRLLIIVILLLNLTGLIFHLIEPNTFRTFFDGLWWAVITFATIGYGDYIPSTTLSKSVSIIFIFIGAAFMSYFLTILAREAMVSQLKENYGRTAFKGVKHMIVVGWNERSKAMIAALQKQASHRHPIVLIDSSLKELPPNEDLHFIKGRSYEDPTLIQANIQKANYLIITADPDVVEQEADMRTIMTLLAAKGLNPALTAIAEILTDNQMDNARRAGADHIVKTSALTTQAFSELLVESKGP